MPIAQWIDRYEEAWRPDRDEETAALTRARRDVLRALNTYQPGPGEPEQPSLEQLADVACCTVRTVRNALKQARRLGLLKDAGK